MLPFVGWHWPHRDDDCGFFIALTARMPVTGQRTRIGPAAVAMVQPAMAAAAQKTALQALPATGALIWVANATTAVISTKPKQQHHAEAGDASSEPFSLARVVEVNGTICTR